jgi:hypothetical protein
MWLKLLKEASRLWLWMIRKEETEQVKRSVELGAFMLLLEAAERLMMWLWIQ